MSSSMMPPQKQADLRKRDISAPPTREQETREATSRQMEWKPAALLPDPNDAFDPHSQWSYRWVRTGYMDQSDPGNVSRQRREGWEPVKASEYPELAELRCNDDTIRNGGLMLCKRPMEITLSHRAAIARQTGRQSQAADQKAQSESQPARSAGMRILPMEQQTHATAGPPKD